MGGTISAFTPVEGGPAEDVPNVYLCDESRASQQEGAVVDSIPEMQKTGPSRAVGMCAVERSCKKTTIDSLPDEVLIKVLAAVSYSASSPAEVITPAMTCKRWNNASKDKHVRRRTSRGGVAVKTQQWGLGAFSFLRHLCDSGCLEACFMLGMILFYCVPEAQIEGTHLLLHSARQGHASALHTTSLLSFNGTLMGHDSKDGKLGVALCARAAALGHVDALRELGHCLLDGYGVKQNTLQGWRMLLEAQALEQMIKDTATPSPSHSRKRSSPSVPASSLRNGKRARKAVDAFGNIEELHGAEQETEVRVLLQKGRAIPFDVSAIASAYMSTTQENAPPSRTSEPKATPSKAHADAPALDPSITKVLTLVASGASRISPAQLDVLKPLQSILQTSSIESVTHPAHEFIRDWFASRSVKEAEDAGDVLADGTARGQCARKSCQRPEKRSMEFHRCSSCWQERYCSRSCQLHDWKEGHHSACSCDARGGVNVAA